MLFNLHHFSDRVHDWKRNARKIKEQFIEGANEIDLVRSGLDDMMREAYQGKTHSMIENDISNLRLLHTVALDRIAISDSIGL